MNVNRIQLGEGRAIIHEEKARAAGDLTRLFVERATEGDAVGIAALDESTAIMAFAPGGEIKQRDAIHGGCETVRVPVPHLGRESTSLTLRSRDVALTSGVAADGTVERAQVARRRTHGTGLRALRRSELQSSPTETPSR